MDHHKVYFVIIALLGLPFFTTVNVSGVASGEVAPSIYLPVVLSYTDPPLGEYQCYISTSIKTVDNRSTHTATLLDSGKVLIAGGSQYTGTTDSIELFDPQTISFTDAGVMTEPRFNHSATRLQDGRVLIAGGMVRQGPSEFEMLATAEIYDPKTNSLTTTGRMHIPRDWHSAVLLADGRVLLSGGRTQDVFGKVEETKTAELYDPVSGTFTYAATLTSEKAARESSSILLNDGRVFATNGSQRYGLSHLYNPENNSFKMTSDMNVERHGPAISLLNDGRVFVVGGYASGGPIHGYIDQVETFDPQLEQFMLIDNTGTITDEVYRGAIGTIQNGDVLIVGRYTIYVYYYATNDIKPVASLSGQNYSDLLGRTITFWPDGKFLVVQGSTAAFGSCIKGDK